MAPIPEHAKIRKLSTPELVDLIIRHLPAWPHPGGECGLGSCAPHIALMELADRSELNDE